MKLGVVSNSAFSVSGAELRVQGFALKDGVFGTGAES